MFCTACEIITSNLLHYKSQFHICNVKRKSMGNLPLTTEEYDSESATGDLNINLDFNEKRSGINQNLRAEAQKICNACMFCGSEGSHTHHREHGLSDEQNYYLTKMQCYICYEKFFEIDLLMNHIDNNEHKSIFTDGSSLYLENGRILNKSTKHMPVKLEIAQSTSTPSFKKENIQEVKIKETREREKLSICITSNRLFGKFLH